ncbi:unnamed protein product [Paramecium sonneborni]|uniref:Uncharacterized protein n=1 Tax=Paramecium sonneborni TaxID=65129 RepID=A0A8S1LQ23_9CILI|nr:unnamed protein product [Paramecium sonneborni]
MNNFSSMKLNLTSQVSQGQICREALIKLTIKLDPGQYSCIDIFEDSCPDILAKKFVSDNNLNKEYTEPLRQNIISQMLIYDHKINEELVKNCDQIQNKDNEVIFAQNKDNKQKHLHKNGLIKFQTFEKQNIERQNKNNIFQINGARYSKSPLTKQQSIDVQKQQNQKKKQTYTINNCKQFESFFSKKETKISILQYEDRIDQEFRLQNKYSDYENNSYFEECQIQNDNPFTSAQIENSLSTFLKNTEKRIINRLFNIIQTNSIVDPRKIPYEEFNYQIIVQLRQHFQKHNFDLMNQVEFQQSVSKNHELIKQAAIFFQI